MRLMPSAAGLAIAAGIVGAAAAPANAAVQKAGAETPQRKVNISKPAQKAVIDLQNSVNAKEVAAIPAKLAAAKAAATTDEDRYYIGVLELRAGIAANDHAMAASGIEAMLASNKVPPEEQAAQYFNLGKVYNNLKQLDKAVPALERAAQLDPGNTDIMILLGELQNSRGQAAAGVDWIRKAIAAKTAAGQKADENWYRRALTLANSAKLPVLMDISREWVQAYPTSASWRDTLRIYRNSAKPPEPILFDLLRLARVTGALDGDVDYNAYVYIAADQRNASEGKRLIDEAAAAGKVDLNKPLFKEMVAALKTKPMPGEDILAKSAATQLTGTDGAALMVTANRYYGLGNYAKAAELFRAALGKPGVDKDQANLELGIALAGAGDKAGAKAAFEAVSGPRSGVAKYWLLYLSTKA